MIDNRNQINQRPGDNSVDPLFIFPPGPCNGPGCPGWGSGWGSCTGPGCRGWGSGPWRGPGWDHGHGGHGHGRGPCRGPGCHGGRW